VDVPFFYLFSGEEIMRSTAIFVALITSVCLVSLVAEAGDANRTYTYSTSQVCMAASGFTPGFDPLNGALIVWQAYSGTIQFDPIHHKAHETLQGTAMWNPFPPPGAPTVVFYEGTCTYNFDLSPDGSFSIQAPTEGCKTFGRNGVFAGETYISTGAKWTGQFAPDKQSYTGANTGMGDLITIQIYNSGGILTGQNQRVCTTVTNGARSGR
jgi:hypothetical protein